MALKRVFEKYCILDNDLNRSQMNKAQFQKVFRDSNILKGVVSIRTIDHIYFKICQSSCQRINFVQFIEGLRFVVMYNRLSLNEIIEKIVLTEGPINELNNHDKYCGQN